MCVMCGKPEPMIKCLTDVQVKDELSMVDWTINPVLQSKSQLIKTTVKKVLAGHCWLLN